MLKTSSGESDCMQKQSGDKVLQTKMWGEPWPKGGPETTIPKYQTSKILCDHILQKQQIKFVLNHEGKSEKLDR